MPGDALEDRGLARAVGSDEGQDLPGLDADVDVPDQGIAVVADGQVLRAEIILVHHRTPLRFVAVTADQHGDDHRRAEQGRHGADGQLHRGKGRAGDVIAEQTEYAAAQEGGRDHQNGLGGLQQHFDEVGHRDAYKGIIK